MINCLITGVGGQGTVLASRLLAEAAMNAGYQLRTTETIGMAQRGGSVVSHIRMGKDIQAPLIAKRQADLIIGFEPAEAVRLIPYLKEDGVMVVNTQPIMPIINPEGYDLEALISFLKSKVKALILVEGDALCKKLASPKAINVALLGAAIGSKVLPVSKEEIEAVIQTKVKKQFVEMNIEALDMGYKEAIK